MEKNDIKPFTDLEDKIFTVLLNYSYAKRTMAATALGELFQVEHAALQAKCDRYEKALKEIELVGHGGRPFSIAECKRIANEALSGEGEGEKPDGGKIIVCNNSDAFRYWTANIKGYRIAHKGHATVIWLPKGMTSEMLAKEWQEYENANNPTNQKEDKQ